MSRSPHPGPGRLALLAAAGLLVHGCAIAPPIYAKVDSLTDPDYTGGKRYIVETVKLDNSQNDLEYKEYSRYLDAVLADKGYTKVPTRDQADQVILLTVGMSKPIKENYVRSVPTFGQTGVSSSQTYGKVSSYGNYSSTTTYTPTYGITGSSTYSGTSTSFARMVMVASYRRHETAAADAADTTPIWQTTVTSVGSSGDLRFIVPYLMSAMKQYVGTNTRHQIDVNINQNDLGAKILRGDPLPPPPPPPPKRNPDE